MSFRRELGDDRQQVLEIMAATPGLRRQIQTHIETIEAARDPAAKAPIPIEYPQIHFGSLRELHLRNRHDRQGYAAGL